MHEREGHTSSGARREPVPGPAESKTLSMRGHPTHENREAQEVAAARAAVRSGKARSRKPDAHASWESDIGIVPMMASNKAGVAPAEETKEGRPMTKENPGEAAATGTQRPGQALSGLDRVRKAATNACASVIQGRSRMR